jgi:hypothetical protein
MGGWVGGQRVRSGCAEGWVGGGMGGWMGGCRNGWMCGRRVRARGNVYV